MTFNDYCIKKQISEDERQEFFIWIVENDHFQPAYSEAEWAFLWKKFKDNISE